MRGADECGGSSLPPVVMSCEIKEYSEISQGQFIYLKGTKETDKAALAITSTVVDTW